MRYKMAYVLILVSGFACAEDAVQDNTKQSTAPKYGLDETKFCYINSQAYSQGAEYGDRVCSRHENLVDVYADKDKPQPLYWKEKENWKAQMNKIRTNGKEVK